MATFVEMLQSWMNSLGVKDVPDELNIYEKLMSLASERVNTTQKLDVNVSLWGERHDPGLTGSVLNLTPNNLDLGDVSSAMMRGVIVNLREMMPLEIFQQFKVSQKFMDYIASTLSFYNHVCMYLVNVMVN